MGVRYTADAAFRFFLCDPEGDGISFFDSVEERDKAAAEAIARYLDEQDGWSEEVSNVCAGEVTHVATQADIQKPEGSIDPETGEDEAGTFRPEGIDYRCNYKMLPIKED